jgi:Lar family restriction alleviation protein
MSTDIVELKPCPFCGGGAGVFKRAQSPGCDESFVICCLSCKAKTGSFYIRREAVAAWNRMAGEG